MHPCEVSNLAVNYLRACPMEESEAPAHLVIDDYQSLNRASQVLFSMVPAATAVSYTHLDVYKRQAMEWRNGWALTEIGERYLQELDA